MKKLIALIFCFAVTAPAAYAVLPNTLQQRIAQRAKQVNQPVQIAGDKRLVSVIFEVQQPEPDGQYIEHRYWECPAVLFNKAGALAFDSECQEAFTEAAKLEVGPAVSFRVDLGKLGEYTMGEYAGQLFFFEASYVAVGEGDEEERSVSQAFRLSPDKTYMTYAFSLFNNPENSEVKAALAKYYDQQNLREVNAETLSKYFKQKHVTKRKILNRNYGNY